MTSDTPAASKPTAEAPADVRDLAESVATECMPVRTVAWYAVFNETVRAIMADRAARPSAAPTDVREAGEPVAWRWRWPARYGCEEDWFPVKHTGHVPHGAEAEPLYAAIHPPAQAVEGAPSGDAVQEALEDCISTLALVEREARIDPQHGDEVERLGRRIGFGALMSSAQASWRKSLADGGWPTGGEFVAGPCFATVQGTLRRARAAIATPSPAVSAAPDAGTGDAEAMERAAIIAACEFDNRSRMRSQNIDWEDGFHDGTQAAAAAIRAAIAAGSGIGSAE